MVHIYTCKGESPIYRSWCFNILSFLGDYLSKEKRGLYRSGAETHWRLCHDGLASSPHQLCGACSIEAGGSACKLFKYISMPFLRKHQQLKTLSNTYCVFIAVAEWGTIGTETHRTHPYWQRWGGEGLESLLGVYTSQCWCDCLFVRCRKYNSVDIFYTPKESSLGLFILLNLFFRDNQMRPKRFVTSSALVETKPVRCRRMWKLTHYWLF